MNSNRIIHCSVIAFLVLIVVTLLFKTERSKRNRVEWFISGISHRAESSTAAKADDSKGAYDKLLINDGTKIH